MIFCKMPANPVAWKMHLCRSAAHWHGGQVARAHTEFLALLAQVGRTPQPADDEYYEEAAELAMWEHAIGRAIDAAIEPLKNVYPDQSPTWLSEYQRTPNCLVLAVYLDDAHESLPEI